MLHPIFIGRQKELESLNGLFSKKSTSLAVIKGMRRIEKSRLVEEFAKTTNFLHFHEYLQNKTFQPKLKEIFLL